MNEKDFIEAKQQATQRVAGMDAIDGRKVRDIATIHSAFEAGLRLPESGAAFDALVMLEDIMDQEQSEWARVPGLHPEVYAVLKSDFKKMMVILAAGNAKPSL